jgi:hypothetical protein
VPPNTSGAYAQYGYGALPARRYNGLAVASFVCSIAGLLFVTTILAIVFGFVARSQIRQSHGAQRGDALALAGIIIGFCWAAIFVVSFIVGAVNSNSTSVVPASWA